MINASDSLHEKFKSSLENLEKERIVLIKEKEDLSNETDPIKFVQRFNQALDRAGSALFLRDVQEEKYSPVEKYLVMDNEKLGKSVGKSTVRDEKY